MEDVVVRINCHCYRPQRSCGKVMFYTPVSHSAHRGVCLGCVCLGGVSAGGCPPDNPP